MHSAQWHDGTDLTGKRVAVIGTGASAFQIVPTIAPTSPTSTCSSGQRAVDVPQPELPRTGRRRRARGPCATCRTTGAGTGSCIFWPACDGGLPAMRIDPDFAFTRTEPSARSTTRPGSSSPNGWLDQVADRRRLLAKVVPDYVCLGKRTLQDNGSWLARSPAPRRPGDRADRTHRARRDRGGRSASARRRDVIVYATGFHANRYLWPMEIVGRDGVCWRSSGATSRPRCTGSPCPASRTCSACTGRARTWRTAAASSSTASARSATSWAAWDRLLAGGHRSIEVAPDAHDAYNEALQAELDTMVWSHPSIRHSWYRNDSGKIFILSPWRLVDYWSWTRRPDPSHYDLR
jgi:4-hydroxyacetophenone monooxygenase